MNVFNTDQSAEALISRANKVLPAGSFGNMPGDIVLERGKAGRVWDIKGTEYVCLLYTSPSPRDGLLSRMPSSA